MPRTRKQNEDIRDERRKQLLRVALKVFASRGYAAAKISDIAEEAGLSHGLVHYYFKSKEEIFVEAVRETVQLSREASQRYQQIQGTPLEIIRYLIDRNLKYIDAEENALRWLLMIQVATSETVPKETRQLLQDSYFSVESIAKVIEAGQKADEIIEGDPIQLASAFVAFLQGLILFRHFDAHKLPMPDAEIILRMLKK
jgi:AcrR family transcriptional regulator